MMSVVWKFTLSTKAADYMKEAELGIQKQWLTVLSQQESLMFGPPEWQDVSVWFACFYPSLLLQVFSGEPDSHSSLD